MWSTSRKKLGIFVFLTTSIIGMVCQILEDRQICYIQIDMCYLLFTEIIIVSLRVATLTLFTFSLPLPCQAPLFKHLPPLCKR